MQYLSKLFFFNPVVSDRKAELYIAANAIDYMTWYKNHDNKEGTNLNTVFMRDKYPVSHISEGLPETTNQIAFDGIFFKCTAHRLFEGTMKKFSAWINPDNIYSINSDQPDDCIIFFRSGQSILIVSKLVDLMKSLLEHNKKIRDRKREKYGKKGT